MSRRCEFSPEFREACISNILQVWRSANPRQIMEGRAWYPVANQLAEILGNGDTHKGAGVIAALSANKRWELNVKLATEAFANGSARGHLGDAIAKANAILAGIDPETVLPMDRKTGHFYRCIVNPSDPETVVLDRHAGMVALRTSPTEVESFLKAKSRYAMLAECYREAARRLGELPNTVQAVTWVVWRERYGK